MAIDVSGNPDEAGSFLSSAKVNVGSFYDEENRLVTAAWGVMGQAQAAAAG